MVLLVNDIIAGLLTFFQLFTALKLRNDGVGLIVLVGGFFRRSGDDQRRARFIDQNRINLVDDRVIVTVLHAGAEIELHVVAQIVKTELVVGAVSNVGVVSGLPLKVVHVVLDTANRQTQEAIDLAHPLGAGRGQLIVHGVHVYAT